MTKTIKHLISDSENGALNFDLLDLLTLIPNGDKYNWTLIEMHLSFISSKNGQVPSLDEFKLVESINECVNPFPISWTDLLAVSKLNIQTIDGKIIAHNDEKKIQLIAFDSSYWTVTSNDKTLSEALHKKFRDIRII